MRTTCGGIRRISCAAGLCLVVALPAPLLQGCISPTNYARPGTDQAQVKADIDACTQWRPVMAGVVFGVGEGAIAGAAVAANGAKDRNAAIVAAVIGVLYGLIMGRLSAEHDVKNYDRCMVAKGYHPV
ncbi:MAG TPA: hypothetical protein VHA35_25895 [Dongiaceae bacterium]|nr:hypothetical protein [Dongiaceae bacterium]